MHYFLFGIYPYICLSVLIIGCIVRYERDPFTWKSSSSQLLRRRQLIMGSVLFHAGILTVAAGHAVGLLTPIAIFDAIGISHTVKQLMAIVIGGVAGLVSLIGGLILLHRRVTDPRIRKTSSFADIGVLVILIVQLAIGLATIFVSIGHLDGGEMVAFMAWSQGIFTLNTQAPAYISDAHWIFKLHIFLGLTIFLLFPFTRLVHMLSVPLRYFVRPGYQVVRSRRDPVSRG